MNRQGLLIFLLAAISLTGLAGMAAADTLEMRDGRLIHGKYLGGSQNYVRFLVDGKEQFVATKDIVNLSFDASTGGTAPAAAAPNSTAAPGTELSAAGGITVPAGTTLLVRMIDTVDSSTNKVGDVFHASLEDNLVVGDRVVAPKGADVYGKLEQAKSAGSISGSSDLQLALTGVRVNGNVLAITTSDYNVAGKSRGKQSAERIGGGAALGAIIGAIAGGGKGAAVGAGVGAGAGTAVQVLTKGPQVRVPSETLLEFRLAQPLYIPASSAR